MHLDQLTLYHFKNHENAIFEFSDKINVFVGLNGTGKTNVLDAIYYLSTTKSYFNHSDHQLIFFGCEDCSVSGKISKDQTFDILGIFGSQRKKLFKKNGKAYSRLIDHIGFLQAVFITPYDISLVFEGSEERRKFIDFTISQLDKDYLNDLVNYKKTLDQRNAFLKSLEGRIVDSILIESFNHRLIPIAKRIHRKRVEFLSDFAPIFQEIHHYLSESSLSVGMAFESALNEHDFEHILNDTLVRDISAQRTTQGIHKDDLIFTINQLNLKKFGSQGQIKTFIVSLKLAQYQYLRKQSGDFPILLLDDIFEKIDSEKSQRLMNLVCTEDYGQIFISDTHLERVQSHFTGQAVSLKIHKL